MNVLSRLLAVDPLVTLTRTRIVVTRELKSSDGAGE